MLTLLILTKTIQIWLFWNYELIMYWCIRWHSSRFFRTLVIIDAPNQFFLIYFFIGSLKSLKLSMKSQTNKILFSWNPTHVLVLWYLRRIELFYLTTLCEDVSDWRPTDRPCLLKRGGGQPNNCFSLQPNNVCKSALNDWLCSSPCPWLD